MAAGNKRNRPSPARRKPWAAEESEPAAPSPARDDRRRAAVWAVLVLCLYALLGTWGQFDFSNIMGYYDMLADATLAGQLHLLITPAQVNLIDMIPVQNKYYFNWGPLPVVFHLAPRLLGLTLSDRVACMLAGAAAAWHFATILLLLRSRHFEQVPVWVCGWFVFAFALASPASLLALRGTIYNESISWSVVFILVAFLALLRAQRSPTIAWPLLAGAAVGAAGLTRSTTILYAVPLFLAFSVLERMRGAGLARLVVTLALFSAPVLAAGGAQAAYNQARFGHPLSFGREYKPETTEKSAGGVFRAYSMPENFRHYVLALPEVTPDFPWLAHEGSAPVVHVARAEAMSSLWLGSPFLLFAPLAFGLMFSKEADSDLRLAAAAAALSTFGLFVLMLGFVAASRRYANDFIPLMSVAAFLGAAWLVRRRNPPWSRIKVAAWVLLVPLALYNIQIPFYQSFVTPTPDSNVNRLLVEATPLLQATFPGPRLNQEAAIAANDLATVEMRAGRMGAAVVLLEKAAAWMPESDRIRQNLEMARRMASRR